MASAGQFPSTAFRLASTFVLWLLLALSLCFLSYLLINQSNANGPKPDDAVSRREAILEDKLSRLLTPLLAARELKILVSFAEASPIAESESESVAATSGGGESLTTLKPQVVILLDASRDHGEIEPVIRDLVLSALALQESDLRIVRQVFREPGSYQEWLPPLRVLNMMLTAAIALAAALALLSLRSASPQSRPATSVEDYRLDFQGLHSLSKDEPRRVANVLSQWISQDET